MLPPKLRGIDFSGNDLEGTISFGALPSDIELIYFHGVDDSADSTYTDNPGFADSTVNFENFDNDASSSTDVEIRLNTNVQCDISLCPSALDYASLNRTQETCYLKTDSMCDMQYDSVCFVLFCFAFGFDDFCRAASWSFLCCYRSFVGYLQIQY